ncbi:cAMP-binding domain of CRP or a regulatory subunit of cAMP-dependent protein kinases [Tenacibaculum sp. MAR_2009_124]|uniref:Crp/Fnr family transcriptional regulator n=1 Tax=Tenacibaculum sp. MAR_2009_124 TaxID=1250059 RepID=UPI00089C14F7|nr:Crp/Fnr family transcriptional regulator [Tenacibaculum sp. MAR_2009_124]SEC40947.1 cAMP-binding domain of CRP or a regulatory subunit of cAMP-dependent protein kinases [Tenacibaculum sp. MAR_2009_124]
MTFNILLENIEKYIKLDKEEKEFLLSLLSQKKLRKKQQLLTTGMVCSSKYFVLKGCLKRSYTNTEGKERVFEFCFENQWISDIQSFWKGSPSIFNIEAIEDTEVIELKRASIETLLSNIPKFEKYFRILSNEQIFKQERRIKQALSCSAKERYDDFLMDYPKIELRLPQRQIASYLGVSPEFLSSLRNKK